MTSQKLKYAFSKVVEINVVIIKEFNFVFSIPKIPKYEQNIVCSTKYYLSNINDLHTFIEIFMQVLSLLAQLFEKKEVCCLGLVIDSGVR